MVEIEWTAREIAALRGALRMSKLEFARLLGVGTRTLAVWESGQTDNMHAASRRLLHDALAGADEDVTARFKRSLMGGLDDPLTVESEEVIDMRRREILAAFGAGAAAAATDHLIDEPARMLAAIDTTSISDQRLDHLEEMVEGLGRRLVQMPPHKLIGETMGHFTSVRTCLEGRLSTYHRVRLVRVAGRLSNAMGEILFNQGRFAAARHWYDTAIHAAKDIGDLHSQDIALAGLSYLPTYSDDAEGVLDLLSGRLDQNPDEGPAAAWLWGMAARAHANLGDAEQFERCIDRSTEALGRSTPDQIQVGIFSFRPEKLGFYEAIGRSALGQVELTADAARRVMPLYDARETTEPALVQLEYATALLGSGEVEEACSVATKAITAKRTFLGATVTGRAAKFTAALSDHGRSAVEWRQTAVPALEAARVKIEQ